MVGRFFFYLMHRFFFVFFFVVVVVVFRCKHASFRESFFHVGCVFAGY